MMKFLLAAILLTSSFSLFAEMTKDERMTLFKGSIQRLKDQKLEAQIPKAGDQFPEMQLGEKKVSEMLKEGPLVVVFFRGGWCPYCVKQLKEINQALDSFKSSNAQMVAIAPERAAETEKTKKKNNLNFAVLPDATNEFARKLNLVFKVEEKVASEYKALGIDLSASNGYLPIPATFVIGKDGKISYAFADADYAKRASVEEITKALNQLK